MLSLKDCRQHLVEEVSESLSDEALTSLREQLHIFAGIFIEHALEVEQSHCQMSIGTLTE